MIRENRGSMLVNKIHQDTIHPMRTMSNGKTFFRRYWRVDIHGEYHRFMIWITDEFLTLIRYNGHTFIDDTFISVPVPFTQCLIIMVQDIGTEFLFPQLMAKKISIPLWNINAYGVYHLAGRTSNYIERYNRRIGIFFLNAHANLAALISVIKAKFDFYSEKYKEAREKASGIVCNLERFTKPSIPNDYRGGKQSNNLIKL
ncbi:hypothetical protein HZS_1293 [Henneguya salminicola]|nr:hypothetical protein HZS_1293 [Henneguya salminicola]